MAQTITLTKLREMMRDVEIDERELRPYLTEDPENSRAFAPSLTINTDNVDTEGLEGEIALRFFNWICKKRRQHRYRKKMDNGWNGIRIVSEGDSWFQYPIMLDDVIDQLFDEYAIYSLGAAGDLLADMIAEDEITEAIEKEKPHIFMISGGGNDWVGDGMLEKIVHPFKQGRKAEDYPNELFAQKINSLAGLYRNLFLRLSARFPGLKIICHGYDYGIPDNGQWLGKPLNNLKIKPQKLQQDIVRVLIDQYNEMLAAVSADFDGVVYYVNCRNTVAQSQWHDELHPKDQGFKLVADLYRQVINTITHRFESFKGAGTALCPGKDKMVEDAQQISADNFRRLVSYRYRKLTGNEVGLVSDENQRREKTLNRFGWQES